ncbi:MAG: LAGLIDADG family homing endonuclease [Gallionella sp.]
MKLTPEWIVGFVDGDGHFGFFENQNEKRFYFVVSQDKRSINVLYELKAFFKCGSVHKAGANMREYKVSSVDHLKKIIIPFFQKYNLKTSKKQDFEILACACHRLTESQGVNKLNLNGYLSLIKNKSIVLNSDWLLGFIDAEGCFVCSLIKDKQYISQIIIGLSSKDSEILDAIKSYLGFGVRYTRKDGTEIFQISSQEDKYLFVTKYLLTKGSKDRLRTEKRICARKWSKIILLIQEKKHRSEETSERDKVYNQYMNFKKYLIKFKKV